MASALDLADRQFPEFAEPLLSELQHLSMEVDFNFRGRSASRLGGWIEGSMLLSASLLLPAGAGVVTRVGTTQVRQDCKTTALGPR